MLNNSFLAHMRATAAKLFTDTCTIERETTTRDRYGGTINEWEVLSTGTACRLIQAGQFNTAANALVGGQETLPDTYKLVVSKSITLDVNYRVTVNSQVFYVVRLETDLTNEGFHAALVSRQRGDSS